MRAVVPWRLARTFPDQVPRTRSRSGLTLTPALFCMDATTVLEHSLPCGSQTRRSVQIAPLPYLLEGVRLKHHITPSPPCSTGQCEGPADLTGRAGGTACKVLHRLRALAQPGQCGASSLQLPLDADGRRLSRRRCAHEMHEYSSPSVCCHPLTPMVACMRGWLRRVYLCVPRALRNAGL